MCGWKIRVAGEELAHSESSDGAISVAVAALNLRRIEALVLDEVLCAEGTFHAATLHFSDRASLRMTQYDHSAADTPMFSVRIGSDHWVSHGSDGNVREEQGPNLNSLPGDSLLANSSQSVD